MRAIINNTGYIIFDITKDLFKQIRKDLNIVPFSSFGVGTIVQTSFKVYQILDKTTVIVPIYYGLTLNLEFTSDFLCNLPALDNFNSCNIILKNQTQIECFNTCILEKEKPFGGGIINLNTGSGKTVLALKLASYFATKTLIIVNKIELIEQWKREIIKFLPNVKIGLIQGSKFELEGKDIIIGMLQTISMKKSYSSETFKMINMCIIDETHTIASEVFSKIMFRLRPRYMFGLTATLSRKDKCENIIKMYIGEVLYSNISSEKKQNTEIHIQPYTGKSSKAETLRNGTAAVSTMISNIANDTTRSDLIISKIQNLIKDKDRYILVLSDRIAQLKYLHKKLGPENSGLYIGSMKQHELDLTKTKQVVLGSYGVCNQGFNHPILNCLVFATPRSSITQAIGRIYRKTHNITPLIVDIFDNFSIFIGQHYRRKKIYKDAIHDCVFVKLQNSDNLSGPSGITDLTDLTCLTKHLYLSDSDQEQDQVIGGFDFLGSDHDSDSD
jgi:superfamily II DNA or RNA helicase